MDNGGGKTPAGRAWRLVHPRTAGLGWAGLGDLMLSSAKDADIVAARGAAILKGRDVGKIFPRHCYLPTDRRNNRITPVASSLFLHYK